MMFVIGIGLFLLGWLVLGGLVIRSGLSGIADQRKLARLYVWGGAFLVAAGVIAALHLMSR